MDTVGCGNCAENRYKASLHNCFTRTVESKFDHYEGPIFEKIGEIGPFLKNLGGTFKRPNLFSDSVRDLTKVFKTIHHT